MLLKSKDFRDLASPAHMNSPLFFLLKEEEKAEVFYNIISACVKVAGQSSFLRHDLSKKEQETFGWWKNFGKI